jgi:hypothetical protein
MAAVLTAATVEPLTDEPPGWREPSGCDTAADDEGGE